MGQRREPTTILPETLAEWLVLLVLVAVGTVFLFAVLLGPSSL